MLGRYIELTKFLAFGGALMLLSGSGYAQSTYAWEDHNAPASASSVSPVAVRLTHYWATHRARYDAAHRDMVMPDGSREAIKMSPPPAGVGSGASSQPAGLSDQQPGFTRPTGNVPDRWTMSRSHPAFLVEPATLMLRSAGKADVTVVLAGGAGPASVGYALVAPGQSLGTNGVPRGELHWGPQQRGGQVLHVNLPALTAGQKWRELDLVLFDARGAEIGKAAMSRLFVASQDDVSRRGFGAAGARTVLPTALAPVPGGVGSP